MEAAVERAARVLGYPELRDEQKAALLTFVNGNDVFVSLPTGYGKTICYAALPIAFDVLLGRDSSDSLQRSIVIVVSPLHTLIQDQVASLTSRGLAVGSVTSESSDEE